MPPIDDADPQSASPGEAFASLRQRLTTQAHRRDLLRLTAGAVGAAGGLGALPGAEAKKKKKKKKKKVTTTAAPTPTTAAPTPTTAPPASPFRFDRELGSLVSDHPELLDDPGDLAIDGSGNIYMVEWDRIVKYGPNGAYIRQFGSKGNGNGQFDSPGALAVDASGRMYVADVLPSDIGSPNRIQVLKANGDYLATLSSMNGDHLEEITGIAIASNGHIFIAGDDGQVRGLFEWDASFNFVARRITLPLREIFESITIDSGNRLYAGHVNFSNWPYVLSLRVYALSDFSQIATFGSYGTGDGQFQSFGSIAADASGNVYVSDGPERVQRLTWNGGYTALSYVGQTSIYGSWEEEFGGPGSVAVGNGAVYVVDHANSCLRQYTPALAEQGRIGEAGVGVFMHPGATATDGDGNIYVVDYNTIHKLTSQGGTVKKWGSFGTGANEFSFPGAIAFSPAGELYIPDYYNGRIQVYDDNGTLLRSVTAPEITEPTGVDFAADGSYFVTNDGQQAIHIFTSNDVHDASWSVANGYYPTVALAGNGTVYAAEASDDAVGIYTSAGTPQGSFSIPFPIDVAVDETDRVFVSSWTDDNSRIFVRDSAGAPLFTVGTPGTGPGQLSSPVAIHITAGGALLVSDSDNGLLRFVPGAGRPDGNGGASKQSDARARRRKRKERKHRNNRHGVHGRGGHERTHDPRRGRKPGP